MKSPNKVLILCNTLVFPPVCFEDRGVDFFSFYPDEIGLPYKALRRLTLKVGLLRQKFWYEKWFSNISTYDKIIVFAINGIAPIIPDIQARLKHGVEPIIFFWDPVFRVEECLHFNLPKWSFDLGDCSKYNLTFNSTFYFKHLCNKTIDVNQRAEYDIYFTGLRKGREKLIHSLENSFSALGINSKFILVGPGDDQRVSFQENLEHISKTRAMLDIVQDGQIGLTVRVMESIFMKRKLVTNNKHIRFEKFYNPQNIFIIDVDDLSNLNLFLNSEGDFSDYDAYQSYYDFDNWLNRFNQPAIS